MAERIRLKTAIESQIQVDRCFGSYETYRKWANEEGYILIENVKIPTIKEKGIWYINRVDFDRALTLYKNKYSSEFQKMAKLMMEDYQNGIFHSGKIWITDSKYYVNKGDFRLDVDAYAQACKASDETWFCNICNIPAKTEHNNPECHRCSDWDGCGTDCTLSKVYCTKCGKSMHVGI
ncbi:MAG: hypothetical protein Q8S57_03225 [Methanoregula sp.]|nr:hypothetical protein [Methanoregula sp.]